MRKLLCLTVLVVGIGVSTGCLPYHTTIPGVLDMRPEAQNVETPTSHVEFEKIRFWTLMFFPINYWDAGAELPLTSSNALTNVRWSSRFSALDFVVNWGATIGIGVLVAAVAGPPVTVPAWLFIASRTLRLEADVTAIREEEEPKEEQEEDDP